MDNSNSIQIINRKKKVFEYFVCCLENWRKEITDTPSFFSKLQLHKLLFLASSINATADKHQMLDIFNMFYAFKYGPVEMDIYTSMLNNDFDNLNFKENDCIISNRDILNIDDTDKATVVNAICELRKKNEQYVVLSPFTLVEITHGWTAWQISMAVASLFGNKREKMTTENIISSAIKTF